MSANLAPVITTHLVAPVAAGNRQHARDLLRDLPQDLSGLDVDLDLSETLVATESFLRELFHEVLVERRAHSLTMTSPPERALVCASRIAADSRVVPRFVFSAPARPRLLLNTSN